MATLPQDSFVDVSDGKIGIAFINDSLTEYEVVDTPERVVALSLLRSVKNWIATERIGANYPSQKGGQCIGHHVIRYAIRPHTGTWKDANIPLHAQLFNMMPPLVQTRTHNGELPTKQMSFFEIHNPQLRYSTIKKAEDRDTYLIRICNTTDERQEGKISFDTPLKQAWLTNLNERRESEITLINENTVPITAAPKKIVTIEIEVKAKSSVKN
jgi:alpha-mannosidase